VGQRLLQALALANAVQKLGTLRVRDEEKRMVANFDEQAAIDLVLGQVSEASRLLRSFSSISEPDAAA
jgi:hypothetical protein